MSRYMDLTIIEVQGPEQILARETPGPAASPETVEYAALFKEMNDYFNDQVLTFESHSPKSNEICAAINSHNKWHRVRVKTVLTTMSGAKADCFFLDTGEKQMVSILRIKKIPKKFLTVPFQVKAFALYGLQPLSLVIEPTMKAFKRPCKKWDKSATNHIKKRINHASAIQAVIKSKGEGNVLLAMIYLRFPGKDEDMSLNEDLINNGYAIKDPETIKSFDDKTNNFLPDVFQTKYINQVLSQKPEQLECSVYNFTDSPLNGFHRNPRENDCPVHVSLTSATNIPQVNSAEDDSGNLSSSSSNPSNNCFVFPLEKNSCTDSKKCNEILSKNTSSDTPFMPSDNQHTASHPSALKQLLSYHKMLQQKNKPKGKSKSLKSQSVSYPLPNFKKFSFQTESTSCNLELPASSLQSNGSCKTENDERFHDFEEERSKNPISSVISTSPNRAVISELSSVKSLQTSPTVAVSKLKTGSVLSDFLAYHKRIANNQESVFDLVAVKPLDHSTNISAKNIESSCTNNEKNKSKNVFLVSDCQISLQNNTYASEKSLGSCKSSEPVVSQSLLTEKTSPVRDMNINNSSSNSSHYYEPKSNVPFSGIETESDVRPKVAVPVRNSSFAKSEDGQTKCSENLSSTSDSSNGNYKETTHCKVVTNGRNDNSSNSTRNYCGNKNDISESQNSGSCQSNSSSKETFPALSEMSISAVNVLNQLVSSKLLSSSSCNPMQMFQSLNTFTLNKLKHENDNSSKSGFSKNYEIFTSVDESDLSTTDDKAHLGNASSSYLEKNSCEDFQNQFEKSKSQKRNITSSNSTTLTIPSPELIDCEHVKLPLTQEETFSSSPKSQTRSLQPDAAAGEWYPVLEEKRKKPSQQEDLNWPKIENLPENSITPDLKEGLPAIDIKTNQNGIDTIMHENKKECDSSFELLTTDESKSVYISASTDLSYKNCMVSSDSASFHSYTSNAESCQENKIKDILPLITPENNPSARNNKTLIHSTSSSTSDEQVVFFSDESENEKQVKFLESIEIEKEIKNCFSSENIANKCDFETRPNSTNSSSIADNKNIASSSVVDIKNTLIICEDNTKSPSTLKSTSLNENIESPSTVMLSNTNDNTETFELECNSESISVSIPSGVTMPALIDDSRNSNSKLTSPVEDPKTDSAFPSSTNLIDASVETNLMPLSVLSASLSSLTGPNGITESEDTVIQHVPSSPQTTRNDCSISLLSSTNNENKELESLTSSEILPNNNPDSVRIQAVSVLETSNRSNSLSHTITSINSVSLPEPVDSMLLSETAHNKLNNTLSDKQCVFDKDKNNDLCSDEPHTISNENAKIISASTSEDKAQTSTSNRQPISSTRNLISLIRQMVFDEIEAEDPHNRLLESQKARDFVIGCIKTKCLLESVGFTKKNELVSNWMQSKTTESILLEDSVLFVAEKIPNPIYDLNDCNVPRVLSELVRKLNIQPSPIQAYSWTPALRGKNVIGISPPDSGKTFAYIVPIFTSLSQYNIYSDIKFSNGPFALILVQSWRKAISVYEQCKHINQSNREIIIEVGYGGDDDNDIKTINLLNGCHIFVATLPYFLRMFESKLTNLDRLCHLVIDNADVLLQDFYKEIVDLMCKFKALVESRDKGYQHHQVMAFSSKWTSYIEGFVKNAIQDPVIIITDMMEAAVYGHVKQIPLMCEDSERKDQLLKLVPQIVKSGEKIIIFALDHECFELQSLLNQFLQKPVAVVCDTLFKSGREILSKEWKSPLSEKESYRVLVCSDVVLCDLLINDATCIVHYQMPKSKVHFGLRIQTMSNYYQHYNNDKSPDKIAKSYILITPEDKKQAKSLRSFLVRSTDISNKETWDFLSKMCQVEDLDPKKELCINLKAFGKCWNRYLCNDRHSVVPSVDLNGASSQHICLPFEGDVRVKILHVKSANNFYVRILEHQIGTQKSIQVHSDLATLIMGMAVYYSNHSNRKVLDELTVGILCAVNTSEQFSRVKVLQVSNSTSKNAANLFFVDNGKVESHPICNLYQLADEFKEVPFQAVEVFLCSLYPVDFDIEWTQTASLFAENWLKSKMLYGKIRFVMNNTLWLDPLIERTFLKVIKTVTNGPSLRKELIKHNFAVDNPQHLIQLHTLFDGYVPKLIPTKTLPKSCSTWEFNLENETLQTHNDYENVLISYIFNPEHFYVQKLDMKVYLNDLMMKIQEEKNLETEPQQKREWIIGMHCLSKSSMDSRWYRVIILSILDSKAVVHFVDYGNIEEVGIDELQTMPRELMYLPSQAIECKLAHIKLPEEDQWSAKCNDFMYYMSQTGDGVYKTLAVNVVSEMPTKGKLPQYCVNLLDTSYERVINIGQELVWWKMAAAADNHFKPLFSEPVTTTMLTPSAKIAEICALFYYEQASSQQYTELMSNLKVSLNHPEKLIEDNIPGCFLKLLSYTHNLDMFSFIVDCINLLLSTPSLFDNLLSCGVIQSLGQILKMHDEDDILQLTLQLIQFMTETDISIIKKISSLESGLFSILCEIVKSDYPNEIKTCVCQLLESFCLTDQTCTENLITLQVCPLFLPYVLEIQDHDFTEAYLSLFIPVSLVDNGLVDLKREKPIKEVMKIIEEAKCEKCVYKCLVALKRLADKCRKNKTLLLEHNAVTIFSSCQSLLNGTKAANLCQELLDGLFVKVNQDNKVAFSSQVQPINESNFHVLWCQNKFRLLITVKIKKSEWSGCEFLKTSINFNFVLNDGVTQSMTYELFDELVVEKCAVSVQNNEVILSLCKAEAKHWPRLLQDKYNKPHNIFVDFDKIEDTDDSGSEEVEANEENPFTLEVVVKKPCFKLVKRLLTDEEEDFPLPVDTAKSDEDSLENSDFEEYDRFNIFNAKYT